MKVAKSVLRYVLALVQTPAGLSVVASLGGPPAAMLAKFGAVGISSALDAVEGDELTEQQVADHLATKGLKVVAYDPSTLWGVAA